MFKKITILAMALGALAAFALPMSASAFWTKHHAAITENEQIQLTGQIFFQSSNGGIDCQIQSNVTFEAGSTTGKATTFERLAGGTDTERCKGTGGLAFCQIHNLEPTELPWIVHTVNSGQATADVEVTFKTIHSQTTGGFCPASTTTVTPGTATFTPDNAQTTKKLTLSGQTKVDVLGEETAQIGGQLEVAGALTYGI